VFGPWPSLPRAVLGDRSGFVEGDARGRRTSSNCTTLPSSEYRTVVLLNVAQSSGSCVAPPGSNSADALALCPVLPRARLFPSSGDAVAAALEDRGDAKRPVSQSPQSSVAEIQFLVDARSARCVQAEREAACRNSESVFSESFRMLISTWTGTGVECIVCCDSLWRTAFELLTVPHGC
jgi:hypothetical protein